MRFSEYVDFLFALSVFLLGLIMVITSALTEGFLTTEIFLFLRIGGSILIFAGCFGLALPLAKAVFSASLEKEVSMGKRREIIEIIEYQKNLVIIAEEQRKNIVH